MSHSETPSATIVSRRKAAKRDACSGVRRSGRVTISMSGVPQRLKSTTAPCEPARRPPPPPSCTVLAASSSRCTRVEADHVVAVGGRNCQPAAAAERFVVLADLVRLGRVGIEVVLAVERRMGRDLGLQRQPDLDRPLDRLAVRDRQHARLRRADRADARVGLSARLVRAAAEHLAARRQLHVDLEADHGLPAVRHAHAAPTSAGGRGSNANAPSSACAAASSRFSLKAGPARCSPTGRPSREPARERDRGQAGEVDRQREEVAGVHRERVVDELADPERDRRRGRRQQDVALLEGLLEIAPDERAHALRLAVVGVVVARRQRVGADQAAPLDLAAEALSGACASYISKMSSPGSRRP